MDPNYTRAYYSRGVVYGRIGEHQLAIDDYSKTVLLSPNYVDAYNNRGNVYSRLEEYDKAIVDYDKAIELSPDYPDAHHNRELAYQKLGGVTGESSEIQSSTDFENSNWSMTVNEVADAEGLNADDFSDIGWGRGFLDKTGHAFGQPCIMTFNFVEGSFTGGTYVLIDADPMRLYQEISKQLTEEKGEPTHSEFARLDEYSAHPLDFSDEDAMMEIIANGSGACFQRWEYAHNEYALVLGKNVAGADFGVPIVMLTVNPL